MEKNVACQFGKSNSEFRAKEIKKAIDDPSSLSDSAQQLLKNIPSSVIEEFKDVGFSHIITHLIQYGVIVKNGTARPKPKKNKVNIYKAGISWVE